MSKETISIIIPAYNVESDIERCIDSILNQSFEDYIIYIVEDRSTDATWDVLQNLKKKDGRIRLYRNDRNSGPSVSRNLALDNCQGKWICFIDSDDYIDKDFLKNLYSESENADIVIGSFNQVDKNGKILTKYFPDKSYLHDSPESALNKAYGGKDDLDFIYNLCWNKLYRKNLFKDVRFPVGRLQEDAYVMAFLIYNVKRSITIAPNAIYYYVDNQESISHKAQKSEKDLYRRVDLVKMYLDHIQLYYRHTNLLYLRTRANLLNNIISIYRLHYATLGNSETEIFKEIYNIFREHYYKAISERNPHLSCKLIATWSIFVIYPELYLKLF